MSLAIAARIEEGRPAVERSEMYVWACYSVGYRQSDLTLHRGQVREWYCSEAGLDLAALDSDHTRLLAAARAADDALQLERDGLAQLQDAWDGEAGLLAMQFIQRHCGTGELLLRGLTSAAQMCEVLSADLWRIVDAKVADAIAIDDRCADSRAEWVAAAQTVIGGADADNAIGIIKQQILPYVDNDIRTDWVAAMRSAAADVDAAYASALDRLKTIPLTYFDLPPRLAQLSERPWSISAAADIGRQAPSVRSSPVAFVEAVPPLSELSMPEPSMSEPSMSAPQMSAPPMSAPLMSAPSAPAQMTGLPSIGMPTGSGGLGNSLAGLIDQIAVAVGGLIDTADESITREDSPSVPKSADTESIEPNEDPVDAGTAESGRSAEAIAAEDDSAATGSEAELSAMTADSPTRESDTPDSAVPEAAAEPPPEIGPQPAAELGDSAAPTETVPDDGRTPCEIAADELPQVGQ